MSSIQMAGLVNHFTNSVALSSPKQASGASSINPASLIEEVNETNLSNYIKKLESFKTRYATSTGAQPAAEYLYNEMLKLGYEVKYQYLLGPEGKIVANVIATKRGQTSEAGKILLTAHYDSISPAPQTAAPGADDNASGTAAALEIARVLSKYKPKNTIEIVFFSAEEVGQLGSDFYVWDARQKDEAISAFINIDMIGFSNDSRNFAVFSNPPSKEIACKFKALIDTYLPDSLPNYIEKKQGGSSDHTSFWENGYPGINITESPKAAYPYQHSIEDTFDKLNIKAISRITKAVLLFLTNDGIIPETTAAILPLNAQYRTEPQPKLEYFKEILTQRIEKEEALFKMMRFYVVVEGLKDDNLTFKFGQKVDYLIKKGLNSNDSMTQLFALLFIAKANKPEYLQGLLALYPDQNNKIKPFFLMALSAIGSPQLNSFLLSVYRCEKDENIGLEALKSFGIINKAEGLATLNELKGKESRPAMAKAIEQLIDIIKNNKPIVQEW